MTVDRITSTNADPVLADLTGPGGPFEIVTDDVLGVPLQMYKNRLHALGELITMADGRAGVDFLVQGDRRLTYDEHNALVRRVAAVARGVRASATATASPSSRPTTSSGWCCGGPPLRSARWSCR